MPALLAGCGTKVLEGRKVDYKSARTGKELNVPEDLSKPPVSDRYQLPEGSGATSYSQYRKDLTEKPRSQALLPSVPGVRIERAGTQRWLVVDRSAEEVWPALKEFWAEMGFIIDRDLPDVGIMETDWAENRARIPGGFLRNVLGRVLDQAYSTPERDKFKTRLERAADGKSSEIYVTHRGMYEAYVETNQGGRNPTIWQPRPTDPELEMEMLAQMMQRFGVSEPAVQAVRREVITPPPARAELKKLPDGTTILNVKDEFDRAWRRVGLSLDRLGFSVQDRDRSSGLYFVRYQDPEVERKESSFWSFLKQDEKTEGRDQFQLAVADTDDGSQVRVLDTNGKPDRSNTAFRILALLKDDLR